MSETQLRGTNLSSPIVPFTDADVYPTHYAKYGNGGYVVVDTIAEMNAIPEPRREIGMLVFCKEDRNYYRLEESGFGVNSSQNEIVTSPQEPADKSVVWIDTSNQHGDANSELIASLQMAIAALQEKVNGLMVLQTNGIISGNVMNSVRTELIAAAEPVKPSILDDDDETPLEDEEEEEEEESIEPYYPEGQEPTVKHISLKMGTYEEIDANRRNFINGEPLWCTTRNGEAYNRLYIYNNGILYPISGGGGTIDDDMTEETVNQLINERFNAAGELHGVTSVGFIPVGSDTERYTVKVDENGTLVVYDNSLDNTAPAPSNDLYYFNSVSKVGLLINSFYLGGLNNDEHSYQPCSHNFVELSNVDMDKDGNYRDVNLNGMYLFYRGSDGKWYKLALWGKVPGGGTYLIRGAQCSVMDVNTTKIKVDTYDTIWYDTKTVDDVTVTEPIKFDQTSAAFYLCTGAECENGEPGKIHKISSSTLEDEPSENPINADAEICATGFIDLVSYKDSKYYEKKTYTLESDRKSSDVLFRRWYQLDPVTQSNPKDGISKHNNAKYTTATYINGANFDDTMAIEELTPKASFQNKTIAAARSMFEENVPTTLTCSFGVQASDNTIESNNYSSVSEVKGRLNTEGTDGIGAARTFCWTSVGYYDEYIWLKKDGESEWTKYESIKDGVEYTPASYPGLSESVYDETCVEYYKRQRWETSYGQAVTTHKVLLSGLTVGTYTYKVVRSASDDSVDVYQSEERTFVVKADKDITSFNFLQVTDQQGANWEEYEVWNLSARFIRKKMDEHNSSHSQKYHPAVKDLSSEWVTLDNINEATGQMYVRVRKANTYYTLTATVNEDESITFSYVETEQGEITDWVDVDDELPKAAIDAPEHVYLHTYTYYYYYDDTIPDYDFVINTGDICYNGSRSNEWIDYLRGYSPLGSKCEMLCIGNNDLAPISMMDIGTGGESPWKINPNVFDLFYTTEIDARNKQIFSGDNADGELDGSGNVKQVQYRIPSMYSFNYGEYHFVCMISEIRTISNKTSSSGEATAMPDSTVNKIFGIKDELRKESDGVEHNQNASAIYDVEEGWLIRDLILWKNGTIPAEFDRDTERYNKAIVGNCGKCFVYTHEMPFNIISSASYQSYRDGAKVPRETAKAYLNRYHNFEFQRLFKLWGIPMVFGGHKHTCAMTRPVYDAPYGYNPITGVIDGKPSYEDVGTSIAPDYHTESENYAGDDIMYDYVNEDYLRGDTSARKFNNDGIFSKPCSFNPFVQLEYDGNDSGTLATEIRTYLQNNRTYIKDVYNNSGNSITINDTTIADEQHYVYNASVEYPRVRVELVSELRAPSYIMCQATGFKNKSNSDLAAESADGPIPWERFYVPGENIAEQTYPFYTLYTVDGTNREVDVFMYQIRGMYGTPNKDNSKAGYWDTQKYYLPYNTLETNRQYILSKCSANLYGNMTVIKTQ